MRRESSRAGPGDGRVERPGQLQERRDEARVSLHDRLERPVADPDERPLEGLQEARGQDVGRDPRHEGERSLPDRGVAVGQEGEDLPRVIALRHGKEAFERRKGRLRNAGRAPRAGQREQVRDELLVGRLLENAERLDARLLVLVLQGGEGEASGGRGDGDRLRFADRPEGSGTQERGAPGQSPPVDRESPLGREVLGHLEGGELGEVVPAIGELGEETSEISSRGQVAQEALDAPARRLRPCPCQRHDRVEDRPVDAAPLEDR